MLVRRLILRNFRNYAEAVVDFGPRINVICGANAQGKTSLLEALFLCVSGRSFRSAHLSDLQRQGQPFFSIEIFFTKSDVDQRLSYSFDGTDRRIVCNSTPYQNIAQLLGILPGVVMTPDDIELVKGSPAERRRYLDLQIAQANPLYLHHLARYQRAMRQRNHLLRQKTLASIDSWEQEMATSATYIVGQRQEAVVDLSKRASTFYQGLTCEHEPLSLKYKTGAPIEGDNQGLVSYYLERFKQQRSREMELGWTASGPHKDDLQISIEGKAGRAFASEGQQRSCVAALRMAEWERLHRQSGSEPLLVIDDVAMGLDGRRRERLIENLQGCGQVFLSSCQELNLTDARVFRVRQGTIEGNPEIASGDF